MSTTFTSQQIATALNKAADEIAELDPSDERIRDTVNLMVNAAVHFLANPDDDLDDAIEANYDEDLNVIISWILERQGLHRHL